MSWPTPAKAESDDLSLGSTALADGPRPGEGSNSAGSVITSLLTLYAVTRVWTKAFWRSRVDAPEGELAAAAPLALLEGTPNSRSVDYADRDDVGRIPAGMLVPTMALIGVGLALTVAAGPIFAYADRAAVEILNRGEYISTVLGADPQ